MPRAVGIDLGTTYSLTACLHNGHPLVIPNAEGSRLTPSAASFLRDGSCLVGQGAKLLASTNPQGTILSIKRHMGSDYRASIGDREFAPEEISALILRKLKVDAEAYLGDRIEQAVITVPAYFNASQRQATMDAGLIAGLKVMRLLDEPTASALAYGLDLESIHTVLVWDLGGGTFDVSILELGEGVFEVKAVNGDTWLGGDEYDQRVADYLADQFQKQHGVDLRQDRIALQQLREIAERAKIELSQGQLTRIRFPFPNSGKHIKYWEASLSRTQLEEITPDLRFRMVGPTLQALTDAGLEPRDIDQAILVGGASRMPAIRQLLHQLLGKEPYTELPPDEAVALGAAIQAGILTGEVTRRLLINVIPLSLGIETESGIFTKIIPRNTPVPASSSQIFTNAIDYQTTMNIQVLQGERALARDNMALGQFELTGLPPLPRGQARVEVAFNINPDGVLQVLAQDLLTDTAQRLRVNPRFYGLSPEEISRLREEAEKLAPQDTQHRFLAETAGKAGNLVSAAEQFLQETEDNLDNYRWQRLEAAIAEVKESLTGGDSQLLQVKTQALQEHLQALSLSFAVLTND